jgi:lipopolysaccharide transport system permease protein
MSSLEYEIKPRGKISLGWKELRQYYELFYFFTWRDIKIKYKQTLLGFVWVILQPLTMMGLFCVLGTALNANKNDASMPYALFVLSGLLLWQVFSSGLTAAGNSMVANANIIKKIYFPRLIIPLSSVLVSLFDFAMSFLIYMAVLGYFMWSGSVHVSWMKLLCYLPLSLLIVTLATFGLGCWIAALNVKYRDFRYILPFFIQLCFFITPVFYSRTILNIPGIGYLFALNPVTGGIELFRSAFGGQCDTLVVFISGFIALFLFITGLYYFRRTESWFADLA